MKVDRIDVFDFKVTLTECEFSQIKNIVDCNGIDIEQAFADAIETGLHIEESEALGK